MDSAHIYVWLKGVEGKLNNLIREVNVLKNDLSTKNQALKKDLKLAGEDILELKKSHDATLQKMDLVIRELKRTAGIEELMTLKKYVDLWSPLNFVTQRDVERIVEMKLKR